MWGLLSWSGTYHEVTVPDAGGRARRPRIRVYRRHLDAGDWTVRRGIPVTTVAPSSRSPTWRRGGCPGRSRRPSGRGSWMSMRSTTSCAAPAGGGARAWLGSPSPRTGRTPRSPARDSSAPRWPSSSATAFRRRASTSGSTATSAISSGPTGVSSSSSTPPPSTRRRRRSSATAAVTPISRRSATGFYVSPTVGSRATGRRQPDDPGRRCARGGRGARRSSTTRPRGRPPRAP